MSSLNSRIMKKLVRSILLTHSNKCGRRNGQSEICLNYKSGGFNNYKSHSCRYNEIFFMIDTCQANTMFSKFYSPYILATGSSEIRENSYSVDLMRALHFMKLTVWCNSTRMTMTSASPSSIVLHIISSNSWKVLTRRVSRQCRT